MFADDIVERFEDGINFSNKFRGASRMARIVYSFPRLCHRLMHNYQEVIRLYYGVLQGHTTYQGFFAQAKGLVKHSVRRLLLEALPIHD